VDLQSITSLPLVTVADVMDFCELGQSKTQLAGSLAMVATRMIEKECSRAFAPQSAPIVELITARQTISTRYDWEGFGEITMGGSGLIRISKPQSHQLLGVNIDPASVQVWYDPTRQFTDDTLFDPTEGDYFMEGDTLVIQRGTYYSQRTLKVSYTSGFPVVAESGTEPEHLGSVPEELRQACLFQAAFLKMRAKPDNIGMEGERTKTTKGTNNIIAPFTVLGGLCPEAAAFADPYKRVLIGNS
jgi:hypothetical protein